MILLELIVNMDQTGIVFLQLSKKLWNPKGGKIVAVVGVEEKCTFTLAVGISCAGKALLFQAIY